MFIHWEQLLIRHSSQELTIVDANLWQRAWNIKLTGMKVHLYRKYIIPHSPSFHTESVIYLSFSWTQSSIRFKLHLALWNFNSNFFPNHTSIFNNPETYIVRTIIRQSSTGKYFSAEQTWTCIIASSMISHLHSRMRDVAELTGTNELL